jgi:hypothetical protein
LCTGAQNVNDERVYVNDVRSCPVGFAQINRLLGGGYAVLSQQAIRPGCHRSAGVRWILQKVPQHAQDFELQLIFVSVPVAVEECFGTRVL